MYLSPLSCFFFITATEMKLEQHLSITIFATPRNGPGLLCLHNISSRAQLCSEVQTLGLSSHCGALSVVYGVEVLRLLFIESCRCL